MTTVSPIDPTVDPTFNETLGERLGDPRSEYDRGQLPRQVFGPDELPNPSSIPDHTLVYLLPPFDYVCTAPNSLRAECVGQVLRVAHHTTGGGWATTTWGVCQNVAHRTNLVAEAQRISSTTEVGALDPAGSAYLYATRFPPVTVPPLVDVDTLTPLQRRIHDYLSSGGTQPVRLTALREMHAQGVFDQGRTDANVRSLVDTIVAADTMACDDGKRRFLEAVFLAEPEPTVIHLVDPLDTDWHCTFSAGALEECQGRVRQVKVGDTGPSWYGICEHPAHAANMHARLTDRGCTDFAGERLTYDLSTLPTPEPEPEKREFFPDQTITYTMEDLLHRKVDAGTRFVAVPALIDAVLEAKEEHELCDAGVQAFFDGFGIDASRTVRYGVDFKDPEGNRHHILSFEVTTRFGEDPMEDWCDGDLDEVLNEALDRYFADLEIDDRRVTFHKRFDTYRYEED